MAEADVSAAQLTALQAPLQAAFQACYNQGVTDTQAAGSFTQAQMDQAVAAQQAVDAAAQASAVAALTAQVSALQADDSAKTAIINGIEALLNPPAPTPAPAKA